MLIVPMAWAPERGAGDKRLSPLFRPLVNAVVSSDFLFWMAMKVFRPAMVQTILGTPAAVYRKASIAERRAVDQVLRSVLPISWRAAGIENDSRIASTLTPYPIEEMHVPALVISAADDLYDTYDSGLHTAEQMRDGRFVGFATGGHLLVGHDEEVRSDIAMFLQEHVTPGTAMAV
jgi:pimeloyl-ACP methyl ester carboxylesterase